MHRHGSTHPLARADRAPRPANHVLTPHPGEDLCSRSTSNACVRARTQSGAASYWRDGSAPDKDKGVGKEFEYKDDWGELSTGKRVSRLFVLHVFTNTVKMVQGTCVTPAFFSGPRT